MARPSRSYGDACGIARALDVVGERWSLLVVRELLLGPKRFTDLRAGLPRVSAEMLGQRLGDLEAAGVVRRETLPPPAPARLYRLTERGRGLGPVVLGLAAWGEGAPVPGTATDPSPDSAALALLALAEPARSAGLRLVLGLDLDGHAFTVTIDQGRLDVVRSPPGTGAALEPTQPVATAGATAADAVLALSPATLLALVRRQQSLDAALASGRARLTGSSGAVRRLLAVFPARRPA